MSDVKTTIAELRLRAGLTQADLAEIVGVNEATIANWESGSALKWIRHLLKICDALNCELRDLDPTCSTPDTSSYPLNPIILSTIDDYCKAVKEGDKKTSSTIRAFATLKSATSSNEIGWRYWLEKADQVISDISAQGSNNMDPEAIINALILQNLTSQLALHPVNEITEDKLVSIINQVQLSNEFIKRYVVFNDKSSESDNYVRKLILNTNILTVYVISWRPGQESWLHHHGNSLDVIYVVEGEMTHWLLDYESWVNDPLITVGFDGASRKKYEGDIKPTTISQGEFIVIPRRYAHQIDNQSDQDLISLHFRLGIAPDDERWADSGKNSEDHLMFTWQQESPIQIQKPSKISS